MLGDEERHAVLTAQPVSDGALRVDHVRVDQVERELGVDPLDRAARPPFLRQSLEGVERTPRAGEKAGTIDLDPRTLLTARDPPEAHVLTQRTDVGQWRAPGDG